MNLSFCITCMNRLYQIEKTLRKNLDDNKNSKYNIEFVLVNFNSNDGLTEYILNSEESYQDGFLALTFLTSSLVMYLNEHIAIEARDQLAHLMKVAILLIFLPTSLLD